MSREAGCCAITGAVDMSAVDKLLEGDPNMDEELIGDTTYCDAAHILPHGNNQAEANGSLVSGANLHPTLHIILIHPVRVEEIFLDAAQHVCTATRISGSGYRD